MGSLTAPGDTSDWLIGLSTMPSTLSRSNFSSAEAMNLGVSPATLRHPHSCRAHVAAPVRSSAAWFLSLNDGISPIRLTAPPLPELSQAGLRAKPHCPTPVPLRVRSRFPALARFQANRIS